MSIFGNILATSEGEVADLQSKAKWISDALGGRTTEAGTYVTPNSAMGLTAYYACLRAISEDIGKLPLKVYKRLAPRGKREAPEHPAYGLLHDAPNTDMTALAFRETLTHFALGWGGGFAEIVRNGRGNPVALYPLHPDRIRFRRDPQDQLYYEVRESAISVKWIALPQDRMLHIHGLSAEGISGYVLSVLAKEAIGLGMQAEKFGARFFQNDARPGGVLKHPGVLKDTSRDNLRRTWGEMHQGAAAAHKVAILEEGMEWQTMSIPPEEAQFIATRQFQVEDVARWFRMPPHKIGHLLRSTFSNIEHQSLEYVGDTLMPWLVRWEQELKRKLFMPGDSDYFAEHVIGGLLRADAASRAEYYRVRFNIGSLSPNDIRELENENPVEGGDTYYIPVNMMALGEPPPAPKQGKAQGAGPPRGFGAIAEQHRAVFMDAAERIVRKETKALSRAMKKDNGEYKAWLANFVDSEEAGLVTQMLPIGVTCGRLLSNSSDIVRRDDRILAAIREAIRQHLNELSVVSPEDLPTWATGACERLIQAVVKNISVSLSSEATEQ